MIKCYLTDLKKIVGTFNSRSDTVKERISELENRSEEIFQNSEERAKDEKYGSDIKSEGQ